jgi:hypothetical protein
MDSTPSDGVKLLSRAARFGSTLKGDQNKKKTRIEPLNISGNQMVIIFVMIAMPLTLYACNSVLDYY